MDVALAAAIGLGCTLEVWVPGGFGSTHMTGPQLAVYVSYMTAVVALAFRRRFPLASAIVVAAALGTEWVAFGSPEGFGVFMIPLVSGYSVAANEERRRALAGLGALVVMALIWPVRDPTLHTFGERVAAEGWLSPVVIGWLIGAYTRELRGRASRAVRERDDQAAAAVASERARIARELHDIVAHAVSVMVLQVGVVRHKLPDALAEDRDALTSVEQAGRTALVEMRRLLAAMRRDGDDVDLMPQPGLDGLGSLLEEIGRAGLPVRLHVNGEPFPLPAAIDLSAYRIVQEGLTNALKHARASHADVTVCYRSDSLQTEVRDDGIGAAASDGLGTGHGHGLVGIRERVKIYGGEMTAGTANGGGFILSTRLPLSGDLR
jgi:signal transduction histidine kinase